MNFKNTLISIDQLFNTLVGGNPDVTISGHVGKMSRYQGGYWKWVELLIDCTFAPIESNHCLSSMLADDDIDITLNFFRTSIVAIIGCTLLFIPIRILGVFKNG